MKQQFVEQKFKPETMDVIRKADAIVQKYAADGYKMTLRQLYYQFVSKNWITNTERSYKRLGSILNDARYAGLIDWDSIEDRNRQPHKHGEFTGLEALANAALASYRLDRWEGQDTFVELWVEKAALAGVLQPLADEWHVTLMVNRGYSSASAMYEAAERLRVAEANGQKPVVLYLGDHDPSGEDMVRDVQHRFEVFGVDVEVVKVGLTMEQVDEYNPPPNPAKMTDSRAAAYVAEHGGSSWEVDALPPDVLNRLIRSAIRERVDRDAMQEVLDQEKADKKKFAVALDKATEGDSKVNPRYLKVETPPFDSDDEE